MVEFLIYRRGINFKFMQIFGKMKVFGKTERVLKRELYPHHLRQPLYLCPFFVPLSFCLISKLFLNDRWSSDCHIVHHGVRDLVVTLYSTPIRNRSVLEVRISFLPLICTLMVTLLNTFPFVYQDSIPSFSISSLFPPFHLYVYFVSI